MPLYRLADTPTRQVDDATTIVAYELSNAEMSVAGGRLDGTHIGPPNRRSETTYVVTKGQFTITVDNERFEVSPGDVVVAPVGSRRELTGIGEWVIINSPPFRPEDES